MESTITAADLDTVALDDMLARLREEALVLTVNKRLAAWLHRRHADLQAADVWETPDILPWNGWLLSLHDQLLTTGRETARLLTNHQESLIWEKIADGWNHAQGREALLRPAAAAAAAADAWKLLHGWSIDPRELTNYPSPESRLLATWFDEFRTYCAQNGWLSAAELPALILKKIDEQAIPLPRTLFLAGFDELTPGHAHLLARMSAAGCGIAQVDNARPEAAATRCCCHDNRDEIRRAAYWARDRLQTNPQQRIGIVIPQLARLRKDVERQFHATLHPETLTAASHSVSEIFNISLIH